MRLPGISRFRLYENYPRTTLFPKGQNDDTCITRPSRRDSLRSRRKRPRIYRNVEHLQSSGSIHPFHLTADPTQGSRGAFSNQYFFILRKTLSGLLSVVYFTATGDFTLELRPAHTGVTARPRARVFMIIPSKRTYVTVRCSFCISAGPTERPTQRLSFEPAAAEPVGDLRHGVRLAPPAREAHPGILRVRGHRKSLFTVSGGDADIASFI